MRISTVHLLFSSFRCLSSATAAEVVIADSTSKVYQLDLSQRTTASMVCSHTSSLINGLYG